MEKLKENLHKSVMTSMMCVGYQKFENDEMPSIGYNCSACGHHGTVQGDGRRTSPNAKVMNNHRVSGTNRRQLSDVGISVMNPPISHQRNKSLPCIINNLHQEKQSFKCRKSESKPNLWSVLKRMKRLGVYLPNGDEFLSPIVSDTDSGLSDNPTNGFENHSRVPMSNHDQFVSNAFGNDPSNHLKHAAWYQPGLSREISMEILSSEPVGSFLVRCSESRLDSFALSLKVPNGSVIHYLIISNQNGWRIKGSAKAFSSLSTLIIHHSVMSELLPCPLLIHGDPLDDEEDPTSDQFDLADYPDLLFTLRKAFGSSLDLNVPTHPSQSPLSVASSEGSNSSM